VSSHPPELEDLDFTALTGPDAARLEAAPITPQITEQGLIGQQALQKVGFHLVMARRRGPPVAGKPLVMVVEDHDDTAELALHALRSGGYATMRAAGSRECSHLLTNLGVPALILLDVELEDSLDGFEMLARFRAHRRLAELPIVMFTARGSREDVVRGLTLGADGYVVKPIAPKALLEVVDTVLGRREP
jgi:two-component system OmpR family response regulator